LGFFWGTADLNHYRRGNQWNYAKFQTGLVLSPCPALVSVGGHKNGSVAGLALIRGDDCAHAGRRTVRGVRSCARTLRRASVISSGVKRPLLFPQLDRCQTSPSLKRFASRGGHPGGDTALRSHPMAA
jgi:hypothetical protein